MGQTRPPKPIHFSAQETEIIDTEIERLSAKGVTVQAEPSPGKFVLISSFVLRKIEGIDS